MKKKIYEDFRRPNNIPIIFELIFFNFIQIFSQKQSIALFDITYKQAIREWKYAYWKLISGWGSNLPADELSVVILRWNCNNSK